MLHSTTCDTLSIVNLTNQKIAINSDDFYGACYGQALLIHVAREAHVGIIRISDADNRHICNEKCTLTDVKFTIYFDVDQTNVHVCVASDTWRCGICSHKSKKSTRTGFFLKGKTFDNLYVCETTGNHHICGVGHCTGPKVSTADGIVCQLTGRIVEDNSHAPIPYHMSSYPRNTPEPVVRAGANWRAKQAESERMWFLPNTSILERQQLFYELVESRKRRMMSVVPIILTTSVKIFCTCRNKAATFQILDQHWKRHGDHVSNLTSVIHKLKRKNCRHCNTMGIDNLTLQKIIEIYLYVFAEWHLRLTLMTTKNKGPQMKEENFALAAFYASKKGMTLYHQCILRQDVFLQTYLRNPAHVANTTMPTPRGWYAKHRFSQVSKQISKWIFSACKIEEMAKCCSCSEITTWTYREDIDHLKASLFIRFEHMLRSAQLLTQRKVDSAKFNNYLSHTTVPHSIKQR